MVKFIKTLTAFGKAAQILKFPWKELTPLFYFAGAQYTSGIGFIWFLLRTPGFLCLLVHSLI